MCEERSLYVLVVYTNKHTCTQRRRSLLDLVCGRVPMIEAHRQTHDGVAKVKFDIHKMHLQNDRSTGLITEEGWDLQLKVYSVRFFNESKFSTLARAPTSSANSAVDLLFLSFPSLGARKDFNGFS